MTGSTGLWGVRSAAASWHGSRYGPEEAVPRLGLHADDLGLDEKVNQAVADLLRAGELTSMSLMANRPHTADAAEIALRYPEVRTYLHLNLTEGRPVSRPEELGAAMFGGLPRMLVGLLRGSVLADQVEAELNAQLDRLADLGLTVDGIDSHHHVHAFAPIGEVVERVAAERSLQHIRRYDLMHTFTVGGCLKKALFAVGARATSWHRERSFRLGPAWSSDHGEIFAVASWERLGPRAAQGVETIVYHPGNTCDAPMHLP